MGSTWEAVGFFAMRTPLLPFDDLEALTGDGATATRHRMRALARRPEVREALFLASPSLDDSLTSWLDDEGDSVAGREERSLLAYLARMSARPTPFGLFAACAVGRVAGRTRLAVSNELRRHTRPDMDYLTALTDRLNDDPETRLALRWYANSSLHRTAGRLRMVETRLTAGVRSHHLVALEADDALLAVLEAAQEGAELDELAGRLVDGDISREQAAAFVQELIDAQVLVSGMAPAVTGPEPLDRLIADLRALPAAAAAQAVRGLERARLALRRLDAAGPGEDPAVYRELARELLRLVPGAELSRLFQVDLFRTDDGLAVGPAVVAEAAGAVELLSRVRATVPDPLAGFRQAFVSRYESAEVPLLDALDEEAGVGFEASGHPGAEEAPLLAGLDLGSPRAHAPTWTPRDEVLLRLLSDALRAGAHEIELDGGTIDALARSEPVPLGGVTGAGPEPLPPTLSVMARIAATSWEAVDEGNFRLLVHGVTGCSGAQLLGRFCHGEPSLETEVRRLLGIEEAAQPDAAFAEIVHLPEGRIGNILCRPVLRSHEIVYLGRSGAPAEAQLTADDLRVSVRGERVVLRSERLGREVVPRLSSAHNTARRSVGLYRFLAALQYQDAVSWLGWDWGALGGAPFLPRVTSGRLVLSRARWRLAGRDVRRPADLDRVRVQLSLPRWIAVADGDNEWVFDLDNAVMVEAVLDRIRQRDEVTLVELFPPPEELCAIGPTGRYVHELILPLARPRVPAPAAERPDAAPGHAMGANGSAVGRLFPPGSEWLYAKLYTGTGTADSVLREPLASLLRSALDCGAADRWFFIRYADPDHHLRVRIHGQPDRLRNEVEPRLHEAVARLMADGRVWRVTYDTYQREIERYGGLAAMEACEAAFAADSEAVLAIVERLAGDAGLEARWQLCLVGVDRLLADFGFTPEARRDWARNLRNSYFAEFAGRPQLARQLGERWRRDGRALQALVGAAGAEHPLAPGFEALAHRSEAMAPIATELRSLADTHTLGVSVGDLVASLAHMHTNRLLRSAARAQELVIYELLARLYAAQLARRDRR